MKQKLKCLSMKETKAKPHMANPQPETKTKPHAGTKKKESKQRKETGEEITQ